MKIKIKVDHIQSYIPVILASEKLSRHKEQEFEASLHYIVRPCLNLCQEWITSCRVIN